MNAPDPTGKTVLILAGEFAGEEGVCLGPVTAAEGVWAVSPDSSDRIVNRKRSAGDLIGGGSLR
jgi:hypothetical protein